MLFLGLIIISNIIFLEISYKVKVNRLIMKMKFFNLIKAFKAKIIKKKNQKEEMQKQYYQSDILQKKLALLIKDIKAVHKKDLKNVECKKMDRGIETDLLTSYRLDFHSRDELLNFKT